MLLQTESSVGLLDFRHLSARLDSEDLIRVERLHRLDMTYFLSIQVPQAPAANCHEDLEEETWSDPGSGIYLLSFVNELLASTTLTVLAC